MNREQQWALAAAVTQLRIALHEPAMLAWRAALVGKATPLEIRTLLQVPAVGEWVNACQLARSDA